MDESDEGRAQIPMDNSTRSKLFRGIYAKLGVFDDEDEQIQ